MHFFFGILVRCWVEADRVMLAGTILTHRLNTHLRSNIGTWEKPGYEKGQTKCSNGEHWSHGKEKEKERPAISRAPGPAPTIG